MFAPYFFGYEKVIASELRRRGAEVDFLPDRPFKSAVMKGVTRIRRELILAYADQYYLREVQAFRPKNYDLVLIVQGEGVSPKLLSTLRNSFPHAAFVLYMWDSFRNKKSLIKNIIYFDRCLTFDRDDAKQYGIEFRPLFFSDEFARTTERDSDIGLSFVGTAHSDRYSIVSRIAENLPDSVNFFRYLYLQAPWLFWFNKLSNRAFRDAAIDEFNFAPLAKSEVQRIFFGSRAVLDIEHPAQMGLTMRTFETLGARKKLITTNKTIREYDFFNPQNIKVIDRDQVKLLTGAFLHEPYVELSADIYAKYSLQGWMDEILKPTLNN